MLERQTSIVIGGANDAASVLLTPIGASEAQFLGAALAAIDPWSAYPVAPEAMQAFLAAIEIGAPRYCVRVEAQPAGVICLRFNWLRGPYIQVLGLLPQAQAQGVGGRLLAWAEGEARERGDRNLWIAASDFNARALAFYERHGFKRVATLEGLLQDDRNEILLRKRL